MAKGKYKQKRMRQQRRETPLCSANLSERVIHILAAHNIKTLYDLDCVSDDTLSAMPRIGEKAMKEIHAAQTHIFSQNQKERK